MVYFSLLGVLTLVVLVVVANVPKRLTGLVLLIAVSSTAIFSSFLLPIPSYVRLVAISSLALIAVATFISTKRAEAKADKSKPIVVRYTFRQLAK